MITETFFFNVHKARKHPIQRFQVYYFAQLELTLKRQLIVNILGPSYVFEPKYMLQKKLPIYRVRKLGAQRLTPLIVYVVDNEDTVV